MLADGQWGQEVHVASRDAFEAALAEAFSQVEQQWMLATSRVSRRLPKEATRKGKGRRQVAEGACRCLLHHLRAQADEKPRATGGGGGHFLQESVVKEHIEALPRPLPKPLPSQGTCRNLIKFIIIKKVDNLKSREVVN